MTLTVTDSNNDPVVEPSWLTKTDLSETNSFTVTVSHPSVTVNTDYKIVVGIAEPEYLDIGL